MDWAWLFYTFCSYLFGGLYVRNHCFAVLVTILTLGCFQRSITDQITTDSVQHIICKLE